MQGLALLLHILCLFKPEGTSVQSVKNAILFTGAQVTCNQ